MEKPPLTLRALYLEGTKDWKSNGLVASKLNKSPFVRSMRITPAAQFDVRITTFSKKQIFVEIHQTLTMQPADNN